MIVYKEGFSKPLIVPEFSEDVMWEQQAKSINTSAPLQSRNEHIMQRLHDIVIAIQTIETYAIEKCVDDYEVKEEWVCEMADLVELYHELNFDKFKEKYDDVQRQG